MPCYTTLHYTILSLRHRISPHWQTCKLHTALHLSSHCWPATRLNLSSGVHHRPIAAQGAACNPKIAREQLAAGSQNGIPHMPSTAPWDPSTNVRRGPRVGDLGGLGTVGVGVMHQRPSRLSWATHSHQSALAVAIEIGAGRHLPLRVSRHAQRVRRSELRRDAVGGVHTRSSHTSTALLEAAGSSLNSFHPRVVFSSSERGRDIYHVVPATQN